MEEIQFLEQELNLMLDNIKRIKIYQKETGMNGGYTYNSLVVGELKHRAISLKQRLTLIQGISTSNLFNK